MKPPFADALAQLPHLPGPNRTSAPARLRPARTAPAARAHPLAPRSQAANPSCGPGFAGTCQVVMEFSRGVARGDARWFQLCAFTPGDENAYLPTSRARGTAAAVERAAAAPPEPTTAPASLASKRKFWELDGAEAAPTRQALRLQWVLPPAAQGARRGAGRAGWRLALESFEVVGLPPGSALAEAPPETAGADIVAEALRQLPATLQPRTRVRLTLPLPRPAAEDAAARRRPPCRSCSPPRRGCSRSRS